MALQRPQTSGYVGMRSKQQVSTTDDYMQVQQ